MTSFYVPRPKPRRTKYVTYVEALPEVAEVLVPPNWPLDAPMIANGHDQPVCVVHVRWADPCLTGAHRYDSDSKNCQIVRDHDCADVLRQHHNGELTKEETEWLLAEAVARGSKVEEEEFNEVIF